MSSNTAPITLYGIAHCDTVKKAQKWLTANNINVAFHDFKKAGLSAELLNLFAQHQPWASLINKRSTTYRQLDEKTKANIEQHDVAFSAVLEQPTLLKRPLLLTNNQLHLGFKDTTYQEIFS